MNSLRNTGRLTSFVLFLLATLPLAAQAGETAADAALPPKPIPANEFIILDFHTFLNSADGFTNFTEDEFAGILDRITAMGYRWVRLEDAVAGKIEGRNNIALTIDDGNHSVYHMVKNLLVARKIPAFLFVYPGIIDSRPFALTTERIRELMTLGCGVGAHGWFHEYMTKKAWAKDREKVLMEVTRPGPLLQKITGQKPEHFAYPFGVGAPDAAVELVKAGYHWIYTALAVVAPISVDNQGINDPAIDLTQIPRTLVVHAYLQTMMQKLAEHAKN